MAATLNQLAARNEAQHNIGFYLPDCFLMRTLKVSYMYSTWPFRITVYASFLHRLKGRFISLAVCNFAGYEGTLEKIRTICRFEFLN